MGLDRTGTARGRPGLESLGRFAVRLEEAETPATVGAVLARAVAETFGFPRTLVAGLPAGGPRGGPPRVLARWPEVESPEPPADEGPAGENVVRGSLAEASAGREVRVVEALDPLGDVWLRAALPDAGPLALAPVWSGGRCAAVLVAEHNLRAGSRAGRQVVEALGSWTATAGLALRVVLLAEAARQAAATDALTGLANRRAFDEALTREVSRALRRGDELSLILVDVDHFSALNERYGRQTGDEVIRRVAANLSRRLRLFDTAARYGGEEFAFVLPSCGTAEALRISEQMRRSVSALPLVDRVTVSTGIATLPTHGVDAAGLVAAAEGALHQSKRGGRDQSTAVGAFPL